MGREAIFGYPYARMHWTDAKSKRHYILPIDRGPETPFPEQLQIDGFHRRGDAQPSGFGPYEQMRLARETNGLFFMLPSPEVALVNRDTRKYDANSLRAYVPDLSSRQDYAAERDHSPMRALIWKIIKDLNPYDPAIGQRVEMQTEFSNDPTQLAAAFQRELAEAQLMIQYLSEAQQALESVQGQRDRESSYRWRANFDLLHAQTMAYRVRLQEYVAYLQAFQQNPKPVTNKFGAAKPSNRWVTKMVARRLTGDEHKDTIERATALFKQVIADHRDTPWAARAEFEMKRHYGIDFDEGYVAPPRGPGGDEPPPVL
ncbi:MAG: hypothetical protein K8T89_16830, partial [Planctomycetes bacterium]|nr:hypothetical protein [Planctomycetota bacterium]